MKHPLWGWSPSHIVVCLFQTLSMPYWIVELGMKNLSLCQSTCQISLPSAYFYGGTSKAKAYASHISGLAMLWVCIFDVDAMLLRSWQKKYGKKMSTNLTQFIPQKSGGWSLLKYANWFYSWHAKKFYEFLVLMPKLYSFNCYSFLTAAVWNGESSTRTSGITPPFIPIQFLKDN